MYTTGSLEEYFSTFRQKVIGHQQFFDSPFGPQRIIYADWTASGRAYGPIETRLQEEVLPFFANTHTRTTITGRKMTQLYEEARQTVKDHVHASGEDMLVFCGSGMTAAVNKLQRIMGLRVPERALDRMGRPASGGGTCAPALPEEERPVVFVTHMEHHSNHISWLETIAVVEIIRRDRDGGVDLGHLAGLLDRYRLRPLKIAAVTACSNVTGIETPYHAIASMMHTQGGFCFVDFASSAPYVPIDMHPGDGSRQDQHENLGPCGPSDLDAIYFSMHKFLGGPGTPGVLLFNKKLYQNRVPDQPGGGTVLYSNPWKGREYIPDIEQREDGGTPPILQGIKAAMCIRLKEEMGIGEIREREAEIVDRVLGRLGDIAGVGLLEAGVRKRLGIISFLVEDAHYSLFVRILNDRFGIQARGGCSCAGPYGHELLGIDEGRSREILRALLAGDLASKPGWVRLSFHPVMSQAEVDYILDAVEITVGQYSRWKSDYAYDPQQNEFVYNGEFAMREGAFSGWLLPKL